ncbi:hypothetical protein [Rubrivirga sp.]|uniref:hypothetical protein n=1 Tax=Rubrivirga sp. TaxID=1885344 RepID=UPI003C727E89
MSDSPSKLSPSSVRIHTAVVAISLVVISIRLLVPGLANPVQVAILALIAAGSGLFIRSHRGGPPWTDRAAKASYAASIAIAISTALSGSP